MAKDLRPYKINPEMKYDPSAYYFFPGFGTKYDPVYEGRTVFKIYGIEFLVRNERVTDFEYDVKTRAVRYFLADYYFKRENGNKSMRIYINRDGKPWVDYNISDIIEYESFCVDGVTITTEKGTYDINDKKDVALLKKLADLHSNRRVLLEYDADAGDGTTIREHDACVIPYDYAPRDEIKRTDD